jgi:multimeric flavodoxin WrbA
MNPVMKIVLISGTAYRGTTYHYAHLLAETLGGELKEFFLPKDFSSDCLGCANCLYKSETLCPHYPELAPLSQAMDEADVLIFSSPTYVYHVSGAMKSFLDHYGWMWMLHRPKEAYFHKIGIAISTCAGGGAKHACQDIADSFFYWGIAKTYLLPFTVKCTTLSAIAPETDRAIQKKLAATAKKIQANPSPKPGLRTKAFFRLVRWIHKQDKSWDPTDLAYWSKRGWDRHSHPW